MGCAGSHAGVINVRSGYVHINYGRLWVSGLAGYGWSSQADSFNGARAYNLKLNASGSYSSDNSVHYLGFPLRCLASSI